VVNKKDARSVEQGAGRKSPALSCDLRSLKSLMILQKNHPKDGFVKSPRCKARKSDFCNDEVEAQRRRWTFYETIVQLTFYELIKV